MNPFEMTVLIVAIVVIGRVISARLGHPAGGNRKSCDDRRDEGRAHGPDRAADPALAAENARLRDDLKALKARVATLERIVTDSSTALDREIESLREKR